MQMDSEQSPFDPQTPVFLLHIFWGSMTSGLGQENEESGHFATLRHSVSLEHTLFGVYLHFVLQHGPVYEIQTIIHLLRQQT